MCDFMDYIGSIIFGIFLLRIPTLFLAGVSCLRKHPFIEEIFVELNLMRITQNIYKKIHCANNKLL